MERDETKRLIGWTIAFGILAAVWRLLPYHPWTAQVAAWNLVPIGALALFAGSRLRHRWAYLVPVAAMFLSDLALIAPLAALGQQAINWDRPIVYASFALMALIGRLVGQRELSPLVIGGGCLLGSLQFFLMTNFAVWAHDAFGAQTMYAPTLAGLGQSYLAGVPFFRYTVASDLFFSLVFFGLPALAELARRRKEAEVPA